MKKADRFNLDEYMKYREFLNECSDKEYDDSLVLHSHHIIPKHLHAVKERVNNKSNLIDLSVEDHIKAHLLLANCYEKNTYEYNSNMRSARVLSKKSITDKKILDEISKTYVGENNPFFGKTHSKETIDRISKRLSEVQKGITYEERYGEFADEEKEKRSKSVKRHWKSMSEEERKTRSKNISKSLKGKLVGSKNPASKQIIVEGVEYETISHAERELNMSRYKIKKYLNTQIIEE